VRSSERYIALVGMLLIARQKSQQSLCSALQQMDVAGPSVTGLFATPPVAWDIRAAVLSVNCLEVAVVVDPAESNVVMQ
jgi:hypothetical protein